MTTPSDRSGSATKAEGPGGTPARQPVPPDRPSERPDGAPSLVGQVLSGRYLIERLIGQGGMGAVYQAQHTHMRKRLAVKVLHAEMSRMTEVVARFEREAMAAAHIEHPNVASATDFGKLDDGSFFLVLEYVEGRGLREELDHGRLELGRALQIVRQIAGGLARAHSIGIVHRDLKPENVMLVERDGESDFVKVLDFGIAKVPVGAIGGESKAGGQVLTQLGMVYGTPEYMAPEQALGQEVDPRADVYALGVMAFEMITGGRPFENDNKVVLLGQHVTAPIPSMTERAPDANIPPEVEAIVTRQLAKDAAARFASARELIEALDEVIAVLVAKGRIAERAPPSAYGAPRVSLADAGNSGQRAALALGPTGLALPSAVSGSLTIVHRSPWITKRRVILGAALLAVLGVAGGAVAVVGSDGAPAAPSASAAPGDSASTRLAPVAPLVDVIPAAQANIDKGDFATAIDALSAVERDSPGRADVHALLERAYTGVHNTPAAMREAGLRIGADAAAVGDLKLEEDIRNAALTKDGQDDAFSLLESRMGGTGIDILYDIAYGASGRSYPQAAARAKHSLDLGEVRARATPALAVLLAFRDAKTCDQKHALLDDVKTRGDSRILSSLQPFESVRGCGFLNRADCYPCMHHDHLIYDTIQAVTERAAKGQ